MGFLVDNLKSARVKWLGRNSGQLGQSFYLSNLAPERHQPSRPSVETEGTVRAIERSVAEKLTDGRQACRQSFTAHRLQHDSGSVWTDWIRSDGRATEVAIFNRSNLKRKVT